MEIQVKFRVSGDDYLKTVERSSRITAKDWEILIKFLISGEEYLKKRREIAPFQRGEKEKWKGF